MDLFDPRFAGVGMMTAFLVLPYLLLGLAFPYMVIRLRDPRDPQAGFKTALHFFFSLAILLLLTGVTIIAVDVLIQLDANPARGFGAANEPFPNSAQRTGFAMLVSGSIFAIVHFLCILTLTRDPLGSPVRRTFLGWRFAIHGVVVGFTVTVLLIVLFQRRNMRADPEFLRLLVGILIVWAPSWIVHFVLLRAASPVTLSPQWRGGAEPPRIPGHDDDEPTRTDRD